MTNYSEGFDFQARYAMNREIFLPQCKVFCLALGDDVAKDANGNNPTRLQVRVDVRNATTLTINDRQKLVTIMEKDFNNFGRTKGSVVIRGMV